ncbi:putative polysaccharide biosynthesis protein [Paenibacillus harenae]|uniref:putative polysaccharide biosynthesis protein n=1 Tax=Paenibacillus harenae TaxID=306543 RepID=UPI0003FC7A47|nr:polysaccharide biosynthesis protein [Paenibacillus harenae]
MLKKDSLIKGTLILAAAALTARFLGLFQRIPLDYMLGADGQASFNLANTMYLLLLTVATGGIPVTISKMISQRYALGRPDEAKQIYKAALLFGTVTGVLLAIGMFVFAPLIAQIAKLPSSVLSLRAIAPALLLFPVIAMTRGYFQGRQIMSAGAISQIVEQILRIIGGIGLALIILGLGWGEEWGAAAIAFGSVFGSIGAFGVMLRYAGKMRKQDKAEHNSLETKVQKMEEAGRKPIRYRTIYREIFTMSIPAVVTAMAVQFVYFFDTTFFMRLTESLYSEKAATDALAGYSTKAMAIAGIPPILAIALGASIIPVIASAFSLKKMDEVQRQASLVMRIVCFTGVPVALLLSIAAYSITGLLFVSPSGSGAVALLTAGTIVQITMMTTNSILYGLDMPKQPMMHTFVGFALKILCSIALAPWFGVYGLIIGSSICFIVITWLNVEKIKERVKLNVLGRRWVPYVIAVVVPAAAGWGAESIMLALTDSWPNKLSYLAAGSAAAVVVGGLYVILLAALRVVTPEDIKTFPGPLRKAMSLILKPFYRKAI